MFEKIKRKSKTKGGAAIASPYVSMARDFERQASAARYQIYQIVKENCSGEFVGSSNDPMEQLLNSTKKVGEEGRAYWRCTSFRGKQWSVIPGKTFTPKPMAKWAKDPRNLRILQ